MGGFRASEKERRVLVNQAKQDPRNNGQDCENPGYMRLRRAGEPQRL